MVRGYGPNDTNLITTFQTGTGVTGEKPYYDVLAADEDLEQGGVLDLDGCSMCRFEELGMQEHVYGVPPWFKYSA
jgi:hypothetical protein